jgi:hypothetical protein
MCAGSGILPRPAHMHPRQSRVRMSRRRQSPSSQRRIRAPHIPPT